MNTVPRELAGASATSAEIERLRSISTKMYKILYKMKMGNTVTTYEVDRALEEYEFYWSS